MAEKKIKKAMEFFSFEPEDIFSDLSENDKKDLYSWCSVVFSNPLFEKLFNELYTTQVLETISKIDNHDLAIESRGQIFGIAAVKDLFKFYHLQYVDMTKKDEPMTVDEKNEII